MENQLDIGNVEFQKRPNQIVGNHFIEVLKNIVCRNHTYNLDSNGNVSQYIKPIKVAPVSSNIDTDYIIAIGIPENDGSSYIDILSNNGCPIILLSIDLFREGHMFDIEYFASIQLFDGLLGSTKHTTRYANDVRDCINILTEMILRYVYI